MKGYKLNHPQFRQLLVIRSFFIVLVLSLAFESSAQLPRIEWGAYFDSELSIPSDHFVSDEELIDQIAVDTTGNGEFIYLVGRTSSINKSASGHNWKVAACGADSISLGQRGATAFLAKYDSAGNLLWSRFLGTTLEFPYFTSTYAYCLALDRVDGKTVIYVGGEIANAAVTERNASACDTACENEPYDLYADDDDEGYIAKYDEDGNLLRWTFMGGSFNQDTMSADAVLGITVHPESHDVYATGYTESINFGRSGQNTGASSFDTTVAGKGDFFIASLSSCLQLTWYSYYGGEGIQTSTKENDGQERGHGIKIFKNETENFVVVVGTVESKNLAVNANYDALYAGGNTLFEDAFIMRWDIDSLTSGPVWANYLGNGPIDRGRSLDFDPEGNIYWNGWTNSDAIAHPTACSTNLGQPFRGGKEDAFVAKFDKDGFAKWITYYGGLSDDEVNGIEYYMPACPPALIIIAGLTNSPNLPHIPSDYPHDLLNGGTSSKFDDVFIAAIEDVDVCTDTQTLKFSTYLGSKADEHNHYNLSYGPYIDMGSNLYLSFSTKAKVTQLLDEADTLKGTYNKGCCSGLTGTEGYIQKFHPFDLCRKEDSESSSTFSRKQIQIYPSLTTGMLQCRIEADEAGSGRYSVLDLYGKELLKRPFLLHAGTNEVQINISGFSSGIYLIRTQTGSAIFTQKVVKQ